MAAKGRQNPLLIVLAFLAPVCQLYYMKTKLAVMFGAALGAAVVVGVAEDKSNHGASNQGKAGAQPAQIQTSTNFLVLGYIETHDRTITIKSGPKGRVYSV